MRKNSKALPRAKAIASLAATLSIAVIQSACAQTSPSASPAGTASLDLGKIPFFSTYPNINRNLWYISSGWTDGDIQSCEWRSDAVSVNLTNIKLTLSNRGGRIRPYGCGEIHTNARTGYGTYSVSMRSAAGSGLNTAFFTYVGPPVGVSSHDEIDFEFLGKNPNTVQVNYFVGGVAKDGTIINLGFDASKSFHTYSFTWEPTRIRWFVDGRQVHETHAGWKMPKEPGRIYMSLWSGSSIINNWLGPFTYRGPYNAEYAWVKFVPLVQ